MRVTTQSSPSVVIPMENLDEHLFDENFLVDVDKAFETIQMNSRLTTKKPKTKKAEKQENEMIHMQATYLAVAQVHLRPTLRYLKAIKQGLASRDLCEIVHYVVGPMINKTRKVGLTDQALGLINFQRELKKVLAARSHRMTSDQRATLASTFEEVENSFLLDFRGHTTAVFNLLGFYKSLKRNPEITESDIKKLFAVGIPSLSMLRKTSLYELTSLSGISEGKVSVLRKEARDFNILSIL